MLSKQRQTFTYQNYSILHSTNSCFLYLQPGPEFKKKLIIIKPFKNSFETKSEIINVFHTLMSEYIKTEVFLSNVKFLSWVYGLCNVLMEGQYVLNKRRLKESRNWRL